MNTHERRRPMRGMGILILAAMLVATFPSHASPQAYPTKPVSLMVGYPAGGSTDVGARIVASLAEKDLGQPIVILNKVGAGGQVGWTEMARQKPDGYYIGFLNLPTLSAVILDPERKATFQIDSFTPIINQVLDPGVIYVKPDGPFKNLKDIVEEARKRPGEVKAGTTGVFSDDHLAVLMLEEAAKVKFRVVHFDGDPPQLTALLGGQIDVSFLNVGGITPRVKAGQVKPLAVMDRERSKFYPDVPTTVELGYPSFISSSTRGIVGPKGLPEPIVQKLRDIFKKAIDNPDHLEKMDKAGLAVKVMMPEEYSQYMRNLHEKMKKLMTEALKAR
jgi:tripartite-type tricarboxylate transporter receptor subunit TctC